MWVVAMQDFIHTPKCWNQSHLVKVCASLYKKISCFRVLGVRGNPQLYPLKWKVLNFSVVLTGSLRSFSLKLMTKLIELVSWIFLVRSFRLKKESQQNRRKSAKAGCIAVFKHKHKWANSRYIKTVASQACCLSPGLTYPVTLYLTL